MTMTDPNQSAAFLIHLMYVASWYYVLLHPDDNHVHAIAHTLAQARPTMLCIPLVLMFCVN